MMGTASTLTLVLAIVLLFTPTPGGVWAVVPPMNVTIDDFFGDSLTGAKLVYGPNASWWNIGQNCTICVTKPNPAEFWDRSWHDVTFFPNVHGGAIIYVNGSFNGSAVYVYTALVQNSSTIAGGSDMTFFIDGEQVGALTQTPVLPATYTYNYTAYSNDTLDPGPHEISIQIGHSNKTNLLILDRIVYTYHGQDVVVGPDSSSSVGPNSSVSPTSCGSTPTCGSIAGAAQSSSSPPSHKSSLGAIIGGVVGGLVAIGILSGGFLYFLRHSRARSVRPFKQPGDCQLSNTDQCRNIDQPSLGLLTPYNLGAASPYESFRGIARPSPKEPELQRRVDALERALFAGRQETALDTIAASEAPPEYCQATAT